MQYLTPSYDPWVAAASVLIAGFASYTAFDIAKRVRTRQGRVVTTWWIGGSIVVGTAIWCTHLVGMLAFSLPSALGYTFGLTLTSWIVAVVAAAVALLCASGGPLTRLRLIGGALAMGVGICAMHYTGMSALGMVPGIVWSRLAVAASAVTAVGGSAAVLLLFSWVRDIHAPHGLLRQAIAATVMGVAICGLQYTGMVSANFPIGTVGLSTGARMGDRLGVVVSIASLALLGMALFASIFDARMQDALNATNLKLQSANEALKQRAFLDPLTGLPNRLLFEDRLLHALERIERSGRPLSERSAKRIAVLFVDLDGFKPVNDSLGHAAGDEVLKESARRLGAAARESDTVARIGGDEFVLLMEDVSSAADCVSLACRLVGSLAHPIEIASRQIAISASIGIVVCSVYDSDKNQLVAQAGAAMYSAKRAGGNTYALFESHMEAGALEQLSLQSDLRQALILGQLHLHYQPKIDAVQGIVRGVEALLRWTHPHRGPVSPAQFIPIAERFGLINGIGKWVIEEACRQMREWADGGLHVRVAINISVHQLRETDLVDRIEMALSRNGIEPSQLLCEITESVAMEDIKETQRAFTDLARIGVFLSIDDFGTGYSSLSYLRKLPARQLKIDRSFVADIAFSKDARAIVSAVIRLAHELGLRVVAEGVETASQHDVLVGLGCDELQGFFLGKPMTAEKLASFAAERRQLGAADFTPTVQG